MIQPLPIPSARPRTGLARTRTAAVAVVLAVPLIGCVQDLFPSPTFDEGVDCPQTIAEAEAGTYADGTVVGAGPVIRFVPSDNRDRRGYDINITRVFTDHPLGTVFLRVPARIPGVRDGQTVLLIADSAGDYPTFVPGDCRAMVEIPPFEQ